MIEVTGRKRRRRKQLLDELKETRGYSKLKEEAPDRTLWRTRFGRGFGHVVKTECGTNKLILLISLRELTDILTESYKHVPTLITLHLALCHVTRATLTMLAVKLVDSGTANC